MSAEHVISGLRANMKQAKIQYEKQIQQLQAEPDKLRLELSRIRLILSIIANTRTEDGIKELPQIAKDALERT